MKIVLTGGTGFIGRRLTERLQKEQHQVTVLTRDPEKAAKTGVSGTRYLGWQPVDAWKTAIEGCDAIVNLAGEPIAQRWSNENKERMLSSRVGTLKSIESVMTGLRRRPRTLISASAIGYYGDRGEEVLDEESSAGTGFLPEICVKWENAIADFEPYGLRTAWIRIGVVLGTEGGALARMLPIYKLGGGGPIGGGEQWMSWIHVSDLIDLFMFALEHKEVEGPLNGTVPTPIKNAEFSSALARAVYRPAFIPIPAFGLKLAFGEMASILLESQRVIPVKTQEAGFVFRFPELKLALLDLFG